MAFVGRAAFGGLIRGAGSGWAHSGEVFFSAHAPPRVDAFLRRIQFGRLAIRPERWAGFPGWDWVSGWGVWIREWGREIVVLGVG